MATKTEPKVESLAKSLSSPTAPKIVFHQGQALLHLAGMYQRLYEVTLELVQNAIDRDVEARRVWIEINYKTRMLIVRDNGRGTSEERFNKALATVATPNRKEKGSLGEFAIGLISPLGKCKKFTFTSCPYPEVKGYKLWTFVTKDIVQCDDSINLPPIKHLTECVFDENDGKKYPSWMRKVRWRSEMCLHDFTADVFISEIKIDELVRAIQTRYNAVLGRNKTIISIQVTYENGVVEARNNVTALDFQGKPLPVETIENPEAGKTKFRIFIANPAKKQAGGQVSMGVLGSDFRFPFRYFARGVSELLDTEIIQALQSGLFEGEILCEKVKLHATRRSFEQDDALLGLCFAIDDWFKRFGRKQLEEARESKKENRHQELGLRSMKFIESLLDDPAHEPLRNVIASFRRGTIGTGHVDLKKQVTGTQEKKSLSVDGNPGVVRLRAEDGGAHDRQDPVKEKVEHTPMTVAGPKGVARRLVKSSSLGLQFAHVALSSDELWSLDTFEGILYFNIRHPLWVQCDVRDTTIMKLQEHITIQALTLHMLPEGNRHVQRLAFDEYNHAFVTWILNGDRERGTRPGRKKA